ncbi:olfactory receptor-like protein DTMT [Pelodytes ibericus]
MGEKNQTMISEIILLGFQNLRKFKILFIILLVIVYVATLIGNLLIIWLVASNRRLQSAMYFFLTQLSVSDIILTTNIVPNTLYITWQDGEVISFPGCIIQFYFFGISETFECFLLSIMAYDRYLAICNPLRYTALMNTMLCIKLVIISWLLSLSIILIDTISMMQLQFCGPNVIDHFFCDFAPLLELSCSDTSILHVEIVLFGVPAAVLPFFVIMASYGHIVQAVLRISTTSGRSKAFSTCSSHLTVVSLFYGTLIGIYMLPSKGKSLTMNKILSLLYTVIMPMINPIIYTLRNKDIKKALRKMHFTLNLAWRENVYLQLEGTVMGTRFTPSYDNLFMGILMSSDRRTGSIARQQILLESLATVLLIRLTFWKSRRRYCRSWGLRQLKASRAVSPQLPESCGDKAPLPTLHTQDLPVPPWTSPGETAQLTSVPSTSSLVCDLSKPPPIPGSSHESCLKLCKPRKTKGKDPIVQDWPSISGTHQQPSADPLRMACKVAVHGLAAETYQDVGHLYQQFTIMVVGNQSCEDDNDWAVSSSSFYDDDDELVVLSC